MCGLAVHSLTQEPIDSVKFSGRVRSRLCTPPLVPEPSVFLDRLTALRTCTSRPLPKTIFLRGVWPKGAYSVGTLAKGGGRLWPNYNEVGWQWKIRRGRLWSWRDGACTQVSQAVKANAWIWVRRWSIRCTLWLCWAWLWNP